MTEQTSTTADLRGPRFRRRSALERLGAFLAAALLGVVVGLAALFSVMGTRNRGSLPLIEPADFYAAKQRWEQQGPPSYDIEVVVTGRQAATYQVQVREGDVVAAKRNGNPLRQQRTWATWSVPGMFGTIQSDVTHFEQHRDGTAAASTPQVQLRGTFDEQYGYPSRYMRTEFQKWGNNYEITWSVTTFRIVSLAQGR